MNVAFINSTRIWSGVKTWTLNLGPELQKLGHTPVIVARKTVFTDTCREKGLITYPFQFGFDGSPFAMARLYAILRRHRITHIIANINKELMLSRLPARLLRIPVINRIGAVSDINPRKARTVAIRKYCCDYYLVPSCFMKNSFAQTHDFLRTRKDRIFVLHHGLDLDYFAGQTPENRRSSRQSLGLDGEKLVVTMVGRLNPRKGHALLLETVAAILKTQPVLRPRILVQFVGDGPLKEDLRRCAHEHGLDSMVMFCPFTNDIRPHLWASDLCVYATEMEGLPFSVLESMAAGLPVIATNVGPLPEIITDGEDGLLVERTRADLARAMETLLGNAALRSKLGARARARIETHFNIRQKIGEFVRILETVRPRGAR